MISGTGDWGSRSRSRRTGDWMSSGTGDWGNRRELDYRRTGWEERVRAAEIRRSGEQGRGAKECSGAAPRLLF